MDITASANWLNASFSFFDQAITLAVHKLYEVGGVVFTPFMELISLLGKGGIFLIFLSLALLFIKKTRRFGTAMAFGLLIGALFVNLFLKVVIAAAFAAMVPLFLLGDKKKSWLALVFGVLMGISRIYLVVHFPSDVLGGLITGTLAGMIGTLIAINLPKKWYTWDLVPGKKKGDEEKCLDSAS